MREAFMNGTDEDVRRMMVAGSSDLPGGIDLLRGVREGQAPARRPQPRYRMRTLVSAGAVAVVAGGTVLATTLTATVATAPPALAAVTAAAAKTSAESFQVTVRDGVGSQRIQVTGTFDLAHRIGEETGPGGMQIIYTGGYMYTHLAKGVLGAPGKSWVKMTELRPTAANPVKLVAGGVLAVAQANPQSLLAMLESAGTVRDEGPASGPGWTGTEYSFTVTIRPTGPGSSATVTGTVGVDRQRRVRDLAATIPGQPPGNTAISVDMTFGDFGVPVSVAPPPASLVYSLAGKMPPNRMPPSKVIPVRPVRHPTA
jgi:hypothetical protein